MNEGPSTVLYLAWAPFYSGAERAFLLMVDHLDRSRYAPVVAIGTDGELASELRSRRIEVVPLSIAYSSLRHAPAWLASVGRLARLARRRRAVLVHANDLPSFQPGGYAARLLGLPALTHVRFPDSRSGFTWFTKPGFTRALFVSEALRSAAIEEAPGLFAGRSDVVYDGVLCPPLVDDEARMAIRRELDLPLDATLVVMAGQVAEVKGLWEFIEAAGLLEGRGVAAHFVVLGEDFKGQGALRREAEQVVRDRGLSDRIQFLGFRPNAPRLIPAFDIIAVPSHVEPLGNATLEAMAAARPVVGSRVGGIPEMVVDGLTGSLVPARDPAGLAAALEALIRNPDRARRYGAAGRQRAEEVFSMTAHIDRIQAIYDDVIGSTGSARPAVRHR
jgi:glycosyltransferase involved in cell wall biosynthesis